MLDAWIIWKYRNAYVFEEASPWVNTILCELKDRSTAYGAWLVQRNCMGQVLLLQYRAVGQVESCVFAMCKSSEFV